jgi:RNA polymerase-interacting CarD/CdnL/TRCF family regulator
LSGWRFLFFTEKALEVLMNFREGDTVMHWTYGLGKVIELDERALFGKNTLYYAVQVGDLMVWVPADDRLDSRLRRPTSKAKFKELLAILSGPGEPLPDDRQERKIILVELLKDGRAESLCRVIRNLSAYQQVRQLNETDQALLKRAKSALLGEWGFALSITTEQAELELHQMLVSASAAN